MIRVTRTQVTLFAGSLLLILLLGSFLYGAYRGLLTPEFVSAAATSVLVLITAGYAVLTLQLVRETRRSREQEVVPAFKLGIKPWAISIYGVQIRNIGNGPAQDISATVSLQPDGPEGKVTYQNVAPGDAIPVPKPFHETRLDQDTLDKYNNLKVDGKAYDIFGNPHDISDTYNLGLVKEQNTATSLMEQNNQEKYMKDIKDGLGDIESEVKSLNRNIK